MADKSKQNLVTLQARARANAQSAPTRRLAGPLRRLRPLLSRRPRGLWRAATGLPPRYALHLLILATLAGALLVPAPTATPAPVAADPRPLADDQTFAQRPFGGVDSQAALRGAGPAAGLSTRQEALAPLNPRGQGGAVFQPFTTSIVAERVNLRNGPGTAFDRMAHLNQGDFVLVLGRFESWLQIQAPDKQIAWVAADLVDVPLDSLDTIPRPEHIPEPPPPLIASATVDELNVRDGPGTGYVRMARIDAGSQLDLLARSGDWLQVQTADGTNGWVNQEYLALADGVIERVPETTDIPPIDPALVGWIAESGINLRRGPGTAYESQGKLAAGTELTIRARYGTWYKVETASGGIGWVASDLIEVSNYIKRRIPQTADIPALPKPKPAPSAARAAAPAAPAPANPRPAAATWVWPAAGKLTSTFGWRTLNGQRNFHNGIDIANRQGTVIVAMRAGTVIKAGWCSGYGYCVMIDHGDGLVSEYGHMMSSPTVVAGQEVGAGQLIGYMGATYDSAGGGYATGVHLHLTLRLGGTAVNPLSYLP